MTNDEAIKRLTPIERVTRDRSEVTGNAGLAGDAEALAMAIAALREKGDQEEAEKKKETFRFLAT